MAKKERVNLGAGGRGRCRCTCQLRSETPVEQDVFGPTVGWGLSLRREVSLLKGQRWGFLFSLAEERPLVNGLRRRAEEQSPPHKVGP